MEVARIAAIGIGLNALLHTGFESEASVDDECPAGLNQLGEMGKTLEVIFGGAVDVQMIRIGRCHNGDIGAQVVERAIKLVGLDNRVRAGCREQEIAVVVAQNAAQKGVAANAAIMQDVGRHARRRGLAMGAGKAQALAVSRHHAQQSRALEHLKAVFAKIGQPLVAVGNGRSIDHQRALGVTAVVGNQGGVLVKVDVDTLLLQCGSQVAWGAVITGYALAHGQKITLQSSHADASGTHEI